MPSPEKQVRVFISSTFRDMNAERDHLVTVVFPELRERLEQLGLEFFDVDLRWGVPEKTVDGETANSWEYCRQWIDRVEPFFVCILGQRYGWVPEPSNFRDPDDRQRQQREPRSITDLEVRHAVLEARRKRRSYFYLRATPVPEPNAEYVDPPEYQGRLEELRTAVRQCGRPARNYSPEWTGEGFAGLKEFGDFVLEDLWSGVLRDERYVAKEVWRQVLGADPNSDKRYTDESLPVPRALWEKIVALAKPPAQDPLDAQRQQMEVFAASRLRWFQGRTQELQQLTDFIHSNTEDAPRLAVVAAAPGQGKSALIAKLASLIPHDSSVFLVTHFVGATEHSAAAPALVQRLLNELDYSGIDWPADEVKEGEDPKLDFDSLCERLRKRLGEYAGNRRIVILLDALNQLTDGHDLAWLPNWLGPGVLIVVSCVDSGVVDASAAAFSATRREKSPHGPSDGSSPESRVLRALTSRQPAPLSVPLGPLAEADVRTIVVEYLKEYCKELDQEQVDAICRMEAAKNPLYLLVMLGELRTLGGNDMNRIVGERITSLPRDFPDTVALFRWVLHRLEVFGDEAVRWWCLYLAYGRVGMASHELADLLSCKLGTTAAPIALLIERGLRHYLLRRGGQLDFYHSQLRQAVTDQYGRHAEAVAVHGDLADYFTACARGTDPQKEWETDCVRGFSECVFHLTKAGQYERAGGLLTTFPFLLHKLRVGLLEGVFEDYGMLEGGSNDPASRPLSELEIWQAFFRENAHVLRRGDAEWPAHKILLQLAVEHADDSPLTLGAEAWLGEGRCSWPWLRRNQRPRFVRTSPCQAVLSGHRTTVVGALETRDGRILSWSSDKTLRLWDHHAKTIAVLEGHRNAVKGALETNDGRFLSWSDDHTLRLWDSLGTPLVALVGHIGRISGALETHDGRILSWADDSTLRLWDAQGTSLAVLDGHTDSVWGALETSDGRFLSWAGSKRQRSHDWTPILWDSHGIELAALTGHSERVAGAIETCDGRFLTWSYDGTLCLWNAGGMLQVVLKGHDGFVKAALQTHDGRFLSGGTDGTLRLWDTEGKPITVLTGHTDWVIGILETHNGRFVSRSNDGILRLWDAQGKPLAVMQGHSGWVLGVLETNNGQFLSWGDDKTLRLWDSEGNPLSVFTGPALPIQGVLETRDGLLLSWSLEWNMHLWDIKRGSSSGLEKHLERVTEVLQTGDGRFLTHANSSLFFHSQEDTVLRLWSHNGNFISTLSKIEALSRFPEARKVDWNDERLICIGYRRKYRRNNARVFWFSDFLCSCHCCPDGRVVVAQYNGDVCFLQVHLGNRPISFAELERHFGM